MSQPYPTVTRPPPGLSGVGWPIPAPANDNIRVPVPANDNVRVPPRPPTPRGQAGKFARIPGYWGVGVAIVAGLARYSDPGGWTAGGLAAGGYYLLRECTPGGTPNNPITSPVHSSCLQGVNQDVYDGVMTPTPSITSRRIAFWHHLGDDGFGRPIMSLASNWERPAGFGWEAFRDAPTVGYRPYWYPVEFPLWFPAVYPGAFPPAVPGGDIAPFPDAPPVMPGTSRPLPVPHEMPWPDAPGTPPRAAPSVPVLPSPLPGVDLTPGGAAKPIAPSAPSLPRPPGRGTKERKVGLYARGRLAQIYSVAGEADDFIQNLYDCLPRSVRAKIWGQKMREVRRGKRRSTDLTALERAEYVYRYADQVDLNCAFQAMLFEQFGEDRVYGQSGQHLADANQRSGRFAGFGFGPAI